jgi:hypothetical protein
LQGGDRDLDERLSALGLCGVRGERARIAGKLIQLRTADVEPTDLPPPFDTSHVSLVEDRKAIYGALGKLGLARRGHSRVRVATAIPS